MRKITEQAARAFLAGQHFVSGNTAVLRFPIQDDTHSVVRLLLHGNVIAECHFNDNTGERVRGIRATLAGWPTVTTRERINGLCQMIGLPQMVGQRKGKQYFGRTDAYGLEKSGIPEREITPNEWFRIV